MRIPYAPSTAPASASAADAAIYQRIADRRRPRPLIPVDLALLHAPPVADGWNSLLGAIRGRASIPADILELCCCRVGALNGAGFEWKGHAHLALQAGIGDRGLATIRDAPEIRVDARSGEIVGMGAGDGDGGLSTKLWAVMAYVDRMTRGVKVEDVVWRKLREQGFSDREIVEITATTASYNAVSRLLVALDVDEMNGKGLETVEETRKRADGGS